MAHLYVSAAHKSSGKTVVAAGLCAAFSTRGRQVQPFKKGPDYIDPMWLGRAAGRPCRNLDFFTMAKDEILSVCARHGTGADLAVIEGTKGLHDGVALDGSDSNAALAKLLRAPVILVVDARGLTRGVAPLVIAQCRFDDEVKVAGLILNRVGGARHEAKLRSAIEQYTDVPVLGAVRDDESLCIPEGHLGLLPANEHPEAARLVDSLAGAISAQVDLDQVMGIAGAATWPASPAAPVSAAGAAADVRVGIARDAAFGFYYPEDLENLERAGASLFFFDTLRDASLPDVDALFLGGGFPERHMDALAANKSLRQELRRRIEGGLPVYAECGGLMYLSRSLRSGDRLAPMVGVIGADTVMHERPQGRGYVKLRETGNSPWPLIDDGEQGRLVSAHEFHYSALENCAPDLRFAFEVVRGHGIDGRHDGIVMGNLVASFAHLRDVSAHPWTGRFTDFARRVRRQGAASGAMLVNGDRSAAGV